MTSATTNRSTSLTHAATRSACPFAPTVTPTSWRSTATRLLLTLSLLHAVHGLADPVLDTPPHLAAAEEKSRSCPTLYPSPQGACTADVCQAQSKGLNLKDVAYRALALERDLQKLGVLYVTYEHGKTHIAEPLLAPPVLLTEKATACDVVALSKLRPITRPCLLAGLQFSFQHVMWAGQPTWPPVTLSQLQEACRGQFNPLARYLVSTTSVELNESSSAVVGVGKVTYDIEVTYRCSSAEANALPCTTDQQSCGTVHPSKTSPEAYDVLPPPNLRHPHYQRTLSMACSWTSIFDFFIWIGIPGAGKLEQISVDWRATLKHVETTPHRLSHMHIVCPDGTIPLRLQTLTSPYGEVFAAGDAQEADYRRFGAGVVYNQLKATAGKTHAILEDKELTIYSLQFNQHNLQQVKPVLVGAHFAQCYQVADERPHQQRCPSLALTYTGLRHAGRGVYSVAVPFPCVVEDHDSFHQTIVGPGSLLSLYPNSKFVTNFGEVLVPPAPDPPGSFNVQEASIKVQYNIFTLGMALITQLEGLITDPIGTLEAHLVGVGCALGIYAAIQRGSFYAIWACALLLYVRYLI